MIMLPEQQVVGAALLTLVLRLRNINDVEKAVLRIKTLLYHFGLAEIISMFVLFTKKKNRCSDRVFGRDRTCLRY